MRGGEGAVFGGFKEVSGGAVVEVGRVMVASSGYFLCQLKSGRDGV